jgi:hypothetical protein
MWRIVHNGTSELWLDHHAHHSTAGEAAGEGEPRALEEGSW